MRSEKDVSTCSKCGKILTEGDEVIILKRGVVIDRVLCSGCAKVIMN